MFCPEKNNNELRFVELVVLHMPTVEIKLVLQQQQNQDNEDINLTKQDSEPFHLQVVEFLLLFLSLFFPFFYMMSELLYSLSSGEASSRSAAVPLPPPPQNKKESGRCMQCVQIKL